MGGKTTLLAAEGGCLGCGVTSEGELHGEEITIESNTESSQDNGEIVPDIVDVLLSSDQLVEGDDTVSAEESVVGSGIQTGAWTSESTWRWVSVLVIGIANSGNENVSDLGTWQTVDLGSSVGVLRG